MKHLDPDRPLTSKDMQRMSWISGVEALPGQARAAVKHSRGRPKLNQPKEHVNIRLDADLVALLRQSGAGWQTRLNKAIRAWLNG